MSESTAVLDLDAEEISALLKRCDGKRPSRADLAHLQELLSLPGMWRMVDLAHNAAMRAITETVTSDGARVTMRANYEGLCRDLGRAKSPPLEQGLIDHVALCWLRLQVVEQQYSGIHASSMTLAQGDYWERRLSAAQRRYLRACESLARVRRLRLPAMQINIGKEQTNIATGNLPRGPG